MTNNLASPEADPSASDDAPLPLRLAERLRHIPAERAPASPPLAVASAPTVVPSRVPSAAPMLANAQEDARRLLPAPQSTPPITWLFLSAALMGGAGWIIERRKRRLLERDRDSVIWADEPNEPSSPSPRKGLDDILPDGPSAAEVARSIYVTAIGETTSRREATLIDLHQLNGKVMRRRARGDIFDAVLLLQQHLVDFRYTSPWAFLELRDLYKLLGRQKEWEIARQAFSQRFGQNAPAWESASTEKALLLDDVQLSHEMVHHWPQREARMFLLRWLLGDPAMRQKCMGPPMLALGIYRDLLFLDVILDEVMVSKVPRPVPAS